MGEEEHLSHAEFALRVLSASADPRRIADVIAHIVGERIEIRSLRVGPGGIVHRLRPRHPRSRRRAAQP